MAYFRAIDDASLAQDGVLDVRGQDFRTREKAGMAENRFRFIVKVEPWQGLGQVHVNIEKVADRSDILPVIIEKKTVNIVSIYA